MKKGKLSTILDIVIILIIMGFSMAIGINNLKAINNLEPIPRIVLTSLVQFGIAGLGTVIIMLIRKESFSEYGLNRKHVLKSFSVAAVFIIFYFIYDIIKNGHSTWMPFRQANPTWDALSLGFPLNILGIALVALCWGFFEGYNNVYISKKVNKLFNISNPFLRIGPLFLAISNVFVHMGTGQSFLQALPMVLSIYIATVIPEITGNSWGTILIFMLYWNAFK